MPNFRLIRAAVKPAKRHEQTNRQTDRQTDSIFIYIDIYIYIYIIIYMYIYTGSYDLRWFWSTQTDARPQHPRPQTINVITPTPRADPRPLEWQTIEKYIFFWPLDKNILLLVKAAIGSLAALKTYPVHHLGHKSSFYYCINTQKPSQK